LSVPERPRVAMYFQMFSPYIVARLNAAAARLNVIAVEGSRRSSQYAWEPSADDDRFRRVTLFPNTAVEDMPPTSIRRAMCARLDASDPDVIVANGWSRVEALTMLAWARRHGRHAILMSESTRNDAPRVAMREAIKSVIVRQFDAALVGGTPQRRYVEELGMPSDRVFLGYDVVDNEFWSAQAAHVRADAERYQHEYGLPDRYFLASARFIEKKNFARLLEAFRRYRSAAGKNAWSLVLVGDGPLRPAIERQVAALGLVEAVRFAGFCQIDELPVYYALAGCLVHVSTVEQWGLVVNEAMASGLPVVVSRSCGCAHDLVKNGQNGYIVDPYDVGEIADRLHAIAANGVERRKMGKKSREIIEDFSPAAFAGGLDQAIALARTSSPKHINIYTRLLIQALAARGGEAGA
jgi:glycosyltransferase involved in cell wall biosynthesis